MVHKRIVIKGVFIRSGLRFLIMQQAYKFDIVGSISKLEEGIYEVDAAGDEENMHKFIHSLQTGFIAQKTTEFQIETVSETLNAESFEMI